MPANSLFLRNSAPPSELLCKAIRGLSSLLLIRRMEILFSKKGVNFISLPRAQRRDQTTMCLRQTIHSLNLSLPLPSQELHIGALSRPLVTIGLKPSPFRFYWMEKKAFDSFLLLVRQSKWFVCQKRSSFFLILIDRVVKSIPLLGWGINDESW